MLDKASEFSPEHHEVVQKNSGQVEVHKIHDVVSEPSSMMVEKEMALIDDISMNEYTENALSTWIGEEKLIRSFLGISGEAGEVMEAMKKFKRGDYDEAELKRRCEKELGDLLFYVAIASHELGISLSTVALKNNEKLLKRMEKGTIKGSGSDR